ncbi:hypothetical protein CON65_22950 [Bacillus pseudomycoides]|uniref:Uncharacterized protein n=1 Tax=Bacillus pseudomycoides TaxID=64104 RepID=A0AA91ZRF2_9BACI|nr:hypothetical protein COO03_12495 [Bacillus sp. AFS098217]PED80364.1 hypothetical protein CON65_22950 [Bacillus pseudomycoides]PEU09549.1 hypothetical protein CN525_24365 [Bacillus sp. AFS014408]PEU12772.1 hypothetical protein CN524_12185 [Bacillus sp. AFS019443]PFW65098.1 hypothetical protein COL20_02020 [Bacillus sp. AFS075034]
MIILTEKTLSSKRSEGGSSSIVVWIVVKTGRFNVLQQRKQTGISTVCRVFLLEDMASELLIRRIKNDAVEKILWKIKLALLLL